MHFTSNTATTILSTLLLASTALAGPLIARGNENWDQSNSDMDIHDMDNDYNIFPSGSDRYEGAICKNEITLQKFPLMLPDNVNGGCVRYFQGVDMTGVVTEVDIYFPQVKSACDCIAACLNSPLTCTNWVYKHTFVPTLDSGKRSCTLYSSPNLPTDVTLAYNLTGSIGFQKLQPQNNPQAGGAAPFTFRDAGMTIKDPYGVSGFMTQDGNNKLYC